MMQEQLVLRCEDSIDGILTAIYEGFCYRKKLKTAAGPDDIRHSDAACADRIRICIGQEESCFLFAQEILIPTDPGKAKKTADTIVRRLGYSVYETLFYALCHYDEERATVAFRFLTHAFPVGSRIQEYLADPYVMRITELRRKAFREMDKLRGFVRFEDTGICLYAEIEPKCNALPLLADHFADRYPDENFMIRDLTRRTSLLHPAGRECLLMPDALLPADWQRSVLPENADPFTALWRRYFQTMGIAERKNERCQRNSAPIWYRKHMAEFD